MKALAQFLKTFSVEWILIFFLTQAIPFSLSADSFDKDFGDFEDFAETEAEPKKIRKNAAQRFFDDAVKEADLKFTYRIMNYPEDVPTESSEEKKFKDDEPTVIEEKLSYETTVQRGNHRFSTSGWFAIGTQEDTYHGFTDSFEEKERRRRNHELNELYWLWEAGYATTTLGKKVFKTGISTTFSPIDRISPVDWNDPLYPDQLGIWVAAADVHVSVLDLTFAYFPWYTPSKYPSLKSRWIPPSNTIIQYRRSAVDEFSAGSDYEYVYPEPSGQFYSKLEITTDWGIDIYASYFEGYSPYPVIHTETRSGEGNKYHIEHIPVKNTCAGLSFVYGSFEFHAEALAQNNNEKDNNKEEHKDDEYISYIYGTMILWNDFIFTLDFTDEQITREKPDNDYESSEVIRSRLHGWIGSITYEFSSYLNARFASLLNTEDNGLIHDLTINWEIIDRLNLSLKFQSFEGEDDSYINEQWGHNDRTVLGVEYTFSNVRDI